ncbi:hypothetical protein [Smaragdicoccus niigatensis]|nr:hypothetical protein [Smaragdicoccus niigatensis]
MKNLFDLVARIVRRRALTLEHDKFIHPATQSKLLVAKSDERTAVKTLA